MTKIKPWDKRRTLAVWNTVLAFYSTKWLIKNSPYSKTGNVKKENSTEHIEWIKKRRNGTAKVNGRKKNMNPKYTATEQMKCDQLYYRILNILIKQ